MSETKLCWKVVRSNGDQLEKTLNELSSADYEIFTVQPEAGTWTIVARTAIKDDSRSGRIGFRAAAVKGG